MTRTAKSRMGSVLARAGGSVGRRRFLKASSAGAALLGLPLLESMPRVGAEQVHPLRFVFVYVPNGTVQDEFWPIGAVDGEHETPLGALTFPQITQPLEPFRDKLLFLKGIDLKVTEVGPGGPHQRGMGSLLTGVELQEGAFRDGCGSMAGWANGISVDQEIARHMGQTTLLPSLELGVRAIEPEVRSRVSYAGPGSPLPPVNSPLIAYERLFSSFSDDPMLKAQRTDVVDALKRQYDELRPALSGRDKNKVDQHLELLRGVEKRMTLAVDTSGCTAPPAPPALDENSEDTMVEIADLQTQLIASALACDLTRVVTLQFSGAVNEIRFPWLDDLGAGHALSHTGVGDETSQTALAKRNRWYAERIAGLLTALDAIPEGDGSVLDHTVLVWGNELGIGNSHTLTNIPFVMAGGASGYFRTGRLLQYDGVAHNQLWVAVLNAMGIDATSFGHPDYGSGALPSLT